MKEYSVSIVSPDPEADSWHILAVFGFWLRHPEALKATPPNVPQDLVGEQGAFQRLGWELSILELDLAYCIHELYTAFEALYADPDILFRKKFAVVYHIDNFYVRVHKLMDNTYLLAEKVAGFNWESKREDRPTRKQAKDALRLRKLSSVSRALETFEKNKRIRRAMEARNLFVHLYRDEPNWRILLSPMDRFYESVGGYEDPEAERIRQITESPDLDRYAKLKAKEFLRTLSVIRKFRDQLREAFAENLAQLASTMSTEVQALVQRVRFHPLKYFFQDGTNDLEEDSESP